MKPFTALIATMMWLAPAHAADAPWMAERFDVVLKNQDLREVLSEFAGAVGAPLKLSDEVRGQASATFDDATAREVLDQLAREHAFDWRFDGRRLEITAQSEQVSRVLDMGGVAESALVEALKAVESYDERFPISVAADGIALISGPPSYVALVEVVLSGLRERRQQAQAAAAAQAAAQAESDREAQLREREAQKLRMQQELELQRAAFEQDLALQRMQLELEVRRREQEYELQREMERLRMLQEIQGPVVIRGGRWGG